MPARIACQESGHLRDREHEHEVEEQLERRYRVLAAAALCGCRFGHRRQSCQATSVVARRRWGRHRHRDLLGQRRDDKLALPIPAWHVRARPEVRVLEHLPLATEERHLPPYSRTARCTPTPRAASTARARRSAKSRHVMAKQPRRFPTGAKRDDRPLHVSPMRPVASTISVCAVSTDRRAALPCGRGEAVELGEVRAGRPPAAVPVAQ
jgi:hypothetical protein